MSGSIIKDDYYCSQKFWWATIEPERRSIASCCAATPVRVDLDWLKNNPGKLFNLPALQEERQAMLVNTPVASCENNCWRAERVGLPSRRTVMKSTERTHTNVAATPETLHIVLGSDCNLTCSYCCKQYSTAWLRDINANGPYLDETRYHINAYDKILLATGQSAIKSSTGYQMILDEIKNVKGANSVEITGGEPFLYNGLANLVTSINYPVNIFSGLGVDHNRFIKILDQLPDTVSFTISAENVGKLYEFNRYGNTWQRFLENFKALAARFDYRFCNVISNLTVHGLTDFWSEFKTDNDLINFCNDPDYLGASVLDSYSKRYYRHIKQLDTVLDIEPTMVQKSNLKQYITQFAARRNITLDMLPLHFTTWIYE